MQLEPRISVLGIGTELTQGQISNSNGQWISKHVEKFGVKTSAHVVVPDDRKLILDSLNWCEERSDILFVTGGLGPTSDDFTRELIAEHFQCPLEWHEASWTHIQAYLLGRGIAAKDVQKQQAYYPRGARVLENDRGTAHGFHLSARGKEIFVLPGPPKEIEGLWFKYVEHFLCEKFKSIDAYHTLSWDCMGAGESELAARTEAALGKHDFEIGYRVHLPYVEVKLTHRNSQSVAAQAAGKKMDQALEPYVVLKNGEDAAEKLCALLLEKQNVQIIATIAGAQIATRLQKYWQELLNRSVLRFQTYTEPQAPKNTEPQAPKNTEPQAHTNTEPQASPPVNSILLQVEAVASSKIRVKITSEKGVFLDEIEGRYPQSNMQERQLQYYAEKAILFWLKKLE